MKLRVYAVFDKAVSAFHPPMCYRSAGEALRSFADAVASEGSPFNKHKSDFSLAFLGTYDDNLAVFENVPGGPQVEADGLTVLAAVDPA